LINAKVAITGCELLIARLGSIFVSSAQGSGRRAFVYPDIHIIIGFVNQLVPDLEDAFERLKLKYGTGLPSTLSLISGPSRTADIEKTLVLGAHGPREIHLFLLESSQFH